MEAVGGFPHKPCREVSSGNKKFGVWKTFVFTTLLAASLMASYSRFPLLAAHISITLLAATWIAGYLFDSTVWGRANKNDDNRAYCIFQKKPHISSFLAS